MFVLKIQESAENYLETIYMLSRHKPYVRSIDIANELSFSKPSVSVAMKNLRENGYIRMDEQGHITLTETGQSIADVMYERHILLSNWLRQKAFFTPVMYRKSTLLSQKSLFPCPWRKIIYLETAPGLKL